MSDEAQKKKSVFRSPIYWIAMMVALWLACGPIIQAYLKSDSGVDYRAKILIRGILSPGDTQEALKLLTEAQDGPWWKAPGPWLLHWVYR